MLDELDFRTADRPRRRDAEAKVTGRLEYGADVHKLGLLHARLVLAPVAHALIDHVGTAAAAALPGVVAVLTARDLPFVTSGDTRVLEPLADTEIVFAGQPVAMVIAETEAAEEGGVDAVELLLTPIEPVLDLEAAATPGSPAARITKAAHESSKESTQSSHGEAGTAKGLEDASAWSSNAVHQLRYEDGNVVEALAGCPIVLERRFRSPWVHQAPLETQTATAWIEPDGTLAVDTSTQGIFMTRDALAGAFGLSGTKVRVNGTPIGGSFGAKYLLVEPLVAAAALAVEAPVRLAMTRTEEFSAGNPAAAAIIDIRVGASAGGELVAIDARILLDDGAFSEMALEFLAAFCFGGPYRWDAFRVEAIGIETNRFGTGAFRAPGAPQVYVALEGIVDELAERLGRDAIDLRLDNLVNAGDRRIDGNDWSHIGIRECLETLRDHPLWRKRRDLPPDEGIGVAAGVWPGATGGAGAVCRANADGSFTVTTGVSDLTGVESTLAAVVAATLGIPHDRVQVTNADTSAAPYSPAAGGSQGTYVYASAVRDAALEVRRQLIDLAASRLEADPDDLEIVEGVVKVKGSPEPTVDIAELTANSWGHGAETLVQAQASTSIPAPSPLSSANLVHVRVDPDTHETKVIACVATQDVGRALHPALIESQIHGGVAQGIGRALSEEIVHDAQGLLLTDSLMTYPLPTSESVPRLEIHLIEEPADLGPFGARGVGEAPVLAVPAAIANAVAAACGVRFFEIPLTPSRIWGARQSARALANATGTYSTRVDRSAHREGG